MAQTNQHHLVLIIARDFASRLSTPVFLVDVTGKVIYFNEGAERVLARRFLEGQSMEAGDWSTVFEPSHDDGRPMELSEIPLGVAILERRPDHGIVRIRGIDGVQRRIEVTAFPLFAHADECLGAIAIFWQTPEPVPEDG
ncbi:MAG TPA: PAS domain-containing protein [Actinomycetota bacterium]|nr:PAS domain-containing protein [Actinomycetota bacterium]